MFEKYLQQSERFFRPMNEIWALQAQAAESFTKTNSNFISDVWRGGLNLAQSLPTQKNMDDAMKLQQEYWQGLTQTMQNAAQENSTLLTSVNQKIADVMQNTSADDVADDMMSGKASATSGAAATAKEAAAAKAKAAEKAAAAAKADAAAGGRNATASPSKAEVGSKSKSTQKSAAKTASKKTDGKDSGGSSVGRAVSGAHADNPAAAPKAAATPKTAAAASKGAAGSTGKADGGGDKASTQKGKSGQGGATSH